MLPASVAAKGRQKNRAGRSAGRQRLALIVFGAIFVVLFIGFAVAQGIGSPSVPSGAVAIVKGVPSEVGTVTDADYQASFDRQVSQSKEKAPKPGDKKYEEVKEAALGELLDTIW